MNRWPVSVAVFASCVFMLAVTAAPGASAQSTPIASTAASEKTGLQLHARYLDAASDTVTVISSRPDTISGGDALVEVSAPERPRWIARLNGHDVTSTFRRAERGGRHVANLTGLEPGKNILEIRVGNRVRSTLELLNHSRSGPMFSGPHQQPFICRTEVNGLGAALDADCTGKTMVQYYYKSTEPSQYSPLQVLTAAFSAAPGSLGPGFKPYDPAHPPTDVAQTTTSDGRSVRYIVRREVGTINRAVYEIQFLHEPGQPLPTPWTATTPGWNGRLVYLFGGGCGGGHHQGTLPGPVGTAQKLLLANGYAVAASTLNVFGHNCNDRLSAETLSMVKEYFIEQFGVPVHTIGQGPSGGSMQVHLIAQNYSGLLDGIMPSVSYPDVVTFAPSFSDCGLLDHVFEASTKAWSESQKTAVAGFATWRTCKEGYKLRLLDPKKCDASIPAEQVYDRVKNPQGVRCDIYTNEVNVLGRNPTTGLARRPLDNVGVQYGLLAFNQGKIDAEQFVELNERIGGYDEDGNIVIARTVADPDALRIAYEQGLVLTGGGGLSEIPIIDWRQYGDDFADIHDSVRSLLTRSRLIAANGHADNHVMVRGPRQNSIMRVLFADATTLHDEREQELLRLMDHWLDSIAADRKPGTRSAKVARNRPAELTDGCWTVDGERVTEAVSYEGKGRCNQEYPPHGDPRLAAGASPAGDVLKCALKPIRVEDYAQPLNADQIRRLKAVFPDGVCDYSRPGIGQRVTKDTWHKAGSGNTTGQYVTQTATAASHIIARFKDPRPIIVAHRGCWRIGTEGSLSGIRTCAERGIDIIETDVRASKDGELFLLHDETLDRTTNLTGRIEDHTAAKLQSARLRTGAGGKNAPVTEEPLPTLVQALRVAKGRVPLILDIKNASRERVYRTVEQEEAQDWVIFFADRATFPAMPEWARRHSAWIAGECAAWPKPGCFTTLAEAVSLYEPLHPLFIGLGWRNDPFVRNGAEAAARAGIRLSSCAHPDYTGGRNQADSEINPDTPWRELLELGVDVFCTDYPTEVADYLRSRHTRPKPAP